MMLNSESVIRFYPRRSPLPFFFTILFSALSFIPVQAQLYKQLFSILETEEGVTYSTSLCLDEDPYGYLWIGTIDGLHKYDGRKFTTYRHIPGDSTSLPANRIDLIHCLPNGDVIVKPISEPVSYFIRDLATWQPLGIEEKFNIRVHAIESDSSGYIWIASNKGLYLKKNLQPLDFNSEFHPVVDTSLQITKLFFARDQKLWMATSKGVMVFQHNEISIPKGATNLSNKSIHDIFDDPSGNIYFLTNGEDRLWKSDAHGNIFQPIQGLSFSASGYLSGISDPHGVLWITDLGYGLHYYNTINHQYQFFSPENTSLSNLGDKYLRKPLRDYAGNIWFPGNPVYNIPATYKKINSFSRSFNNIAVVSAINPEKETLWIGTLGGGLLCYNRVSGELNQIDADKNKKLHLPDERVYCITRINEDVLAVTTRQFLNIYNTKLGQIRSIPISNGPIRWAVMQGDSIWLTHSGTGIFCYHLKKETLIHYLDGKNNHPSLSQSAHIVIDEKGLLWLGTLADGLVCYDPGTGDIKKYNTQSDNKFPITSNTVSVIYRDRSDKWWIGTDAGLHLFDPLSGHFRVMSMKEGLAGALVENIQEDDEGNLWVTSGSGITKYNHVKGTVQHFFHGHGLINQQYYPRTSAREPDGLLYFGGYQGLNSFYPRDMGRNPVPPKVWINKIDHKSKHENEIKVENMTTLYLNYQNSYCHLEFSATHFTNPQGNQFAYRIPEIDEQWNALGNETHITLLGLKPGEYTLEVKAANSDHVWSAHPYLLNIIVTPPFWQTWWFISLAVIVTASFIIWLVRRRIHHIRIEAKKHSDFKEQLYKIEMQALRSQMNPHFLFNSLNSIKSFIVSNEPRLAADYLSKFAMLMRHILNHSKEESITLQEELDALSIYMELEQLRFQNKFQTSIEIQEDINPSGMEIPPMILQPFVENAIWHGLMHKKSQGHLTVRVQSMNGMLHVEVEDDGVGRHAAIHEKSKSAEKKKSYGMQITAARIRQKYQDHSAIEIIDLVAADGSASGTMVKISLPYNIKS